MYEIFPNYLIKYYIIFKKYHLINVYGPENLLHKLTVALALGSPPCALYDFPRVPLKIHGSTQF